MCFVFIWEQTATCATYSINWLVFTTEMKSVYSAVRTGSLNKSSMRFVCKGLTFRVHQYVGLVFTHKNYLVTDYTHHSLILYCLILNFKLALLNLFVCKFILLFLLHIIILGHNFPDLVSYSFISCIKPVGIMFTVYQPKCGGNGKWATVYSLPSLLNQFAKKKKTIITLVLGGYFVGMLK